MSRVVKFSQGGDSNDDDGYIGRVAKYIPGEIVAAYISINALIESQRDDSMSVTVGYWVIAICWLLVPTYIWRVSSSNDTKREILVTAAVGFTAFPVWVYSLGGVAIEHWPGHNLLVAGVLLPLFTLVAGLIDG